MPLTKFPRGVSSFGVPVLGGEGILNKGTNFFVDPVNGNDGYDGTSIDAPFKTLLVAYNACTTNAGDVIYLLGGSTAAALSASLVWSKNEISLIGIGNPCFGARTIISASADFTPIIDFAGDYTYVRNVQFQYGRGSASNYCGYHIGGSYNTFENCWFNGPLNATEAALGTTSITGPGNVVELHGLDIQFQHCRFGNSVLAAAITEQLFSIVRCLVGADKILFEDCIWETRANLPGGAGITGPADIKVAAGTQLTNWMILRRCTFMGKVPNWTYARDGSIFIGTGTSGRITVQDCSYTNYTNIGVTAAGGASIHAIGHDPVAATVCLTVNPS